MTDFIPFDRPAVGEEEVEAVADVLRSGWITTGPRSKEFEQRFSEYVGADYGLALSSGTAALHLGLAAFGVGPGDEVITTPITFCATFHVITQVGATPVPVDVDPDDYNLAPEAVAAAVTPRTRAIMPVHLGGLPCKMNQLLDIARRQDLLVIDDAAHATGARIGDHMVGNIGNATAFSFYATKNLTTGEGGMLTSNDAQVIERARLLSLHGMDRDAWRRRAGGAARASWQYDVTAAGFKYNISDVQSAMGLVQLKKLPGLLERRAEIHRRYFEAFSGEPALIPAPRQQPGTQSAHHLYILRLHLEQLTLDRDEFCVAMRERGVGTSAHFIPIYRLTYYHDRYNWNAGDYPETERFFESNLSLPCYPMMSDEEIQRVIESVLDVVEQHRR